MALDGSKISKLGFGCMRFEGREDDTIDIEQEIAPFSKPNVLMRQ